MRPADLVLLMAVGHALAACSRGQGTGEGDTGVPNDWVPIAAGSFTMGCDQERDTRCEPDELPLHVVALTGYELLRSEVSVGAWWVCQEAGACAVPATGETSTAEGHLPITGVTREQAAAFCAWVGGRLPSEAEWERAARGTDGRLYPWGDDEPDCDRANPRSCGRGLLAVDSLEQGASPDGLLHLVGNGWEWVADAYDGEYYQESPAQDPQGPEGSRTESLRGIDGYADSAALRASNRQVAVAGSFSPMVGFRCARGTP